MRRIDIWIFASIAALFVLLAFKKHLDDQEDPSKESAIRLLKACSGQVEIIQAATGSLLIGCGPAPAEQKKEPTRGNEV